MTHAADFARYKCLHCSQTVTFEHYYKRHGVRDHSYSECSNCGRETAIKIPEAVQFHNRQELLNELLKLCPGGALELTEDGQFTFYTGLSEEVRIIEHEG